MFGDQMSGAYLDELGLVLFRVGIVEHRGAALLRELPGEQPALQHLRRLLLRTIRAAS